MLQLASITKEFSTRVLDSITMQFQPGEIHALLGANGAGKSTLCRIIAGLIPATGGSMWIDGVNFTPRSKRDAELQGIQIVQQELNLIPTLSVAENLYLSRLPAKFGWIHRRELREKAAQVLDDFGLYGIDVDSQISRLGVGQQQLLEIAGNIRRKCRLLILDEPTAALTSRETEHLFEKLQQAKQAGTTVIYISHRLDEVLRLTDRTSVLRDGKLIGTYPTKELDHDRMVELMTPAAVVRQRKPTIRAHVDDAEQMIALKTRNLTREPFVRGVTFHVNAGEVLGIAGLVGSGRTELLRLLFGADKADAGEISINAQPWRMPFKSPAEAVQHGFAMITEDRKANGLLLSQSILDNTILASWSRNSDITSSNSERFVCNRLGWYRKSVAQLNVGRLEKQLQLKSNGLEQPVNQLSGGNQQKVVIAKWLNRDASFYLFDEPTRGIDAAARQHVYDVIEELRNRGKAVIVVSSDFLELTQLCDRIGVLSNGRWITDFQGPEYSEESLTTAMFAGFQSEQVQAP